MMTQNRASKNEILDHLNENLGGEALGLIQQIYELLESGKEEAILPLLKEYDKKLGGKYLGKTPGRKFPGVYRPLSYISYSFMYPENIKYEGREIVSTCGAYLEGYLKIMVRLGFFERFRKYDLPIGALLRKAKDKLPEKLYEELDWFVRKAHNFAKHEYFLGEQEPPEHSFEIDEAIALYLVARKLGFDLEKVIGKSPEELEGKYIEFIGE